MANSLQSLTNFFQSPAGTSSGSSAAAPSASSSLGPPERTEEDRSRDVEMHAKRMKLYESEEVKNRVNVWGAIVNGQNFDQLPPKRKKEATYELFRAARMVSSLKEGETIPSDDDEY